MGMTRGRDPGQPSSPLAALALAAMAVALLTPASCRTGRGTVPSAGRDGSQGGPTTLRVFAAASLTGVMAELETTYEANHPSVDVVVNLAGSSTLRTQILEGAPADVVATANPQVMDDLVEAGMVAGSPRPFASNRLVIALAPGNPGRVRGLADLTRPELFVGLCAAGVPCGDLADSALAEAGVMVTPDTREPDARSLLGKIRSGELDAGLVYATDVAAAGSVGVDGIELPPDLGVMTIYPVALLVGADASQAAEGFAGFLTGAEGSKVLSEHGFGRP